MVHMRMRNPSKLMVQLVAMIASVGVTLSVATTTLPTEQVPLESSPKQTKQPKVPKVSRVPKLSKVSKGKQPPTLSSRSADVSPFEYTEWKPFIATWYSGTGGINGGHITKSGEHVRDDWTVAVDPSVIPLGTLIEIKFRDGTIKTFSAQDTGGAIIGNRVDIFNSDIVQCYRNGRQAVLVRLVHVKPNYK